MKNILITSAGTRVSLVRSFQKELKRIDKSSKVYTVDLEPVLAPACQVSDGFKKVPKVTDSSYIEKLLEICRSWAIKMIIPTIDTELQVLAEHKKLFLKNGIFPVVSNKEFVDACRDKRVINRFFRENGIEIPEPVSKANPTFPLFIKPYDGSRSQDTFLIRNESELTDYHFENSRLMFMEYMDPAEYGEFTVDCYYNKENELCCVVPRKRIEVRAGEVNKGLAHKNEIIPFLKEKLPHIPGAIGCLTMQFFFNEKTGRTVGIEINPRFGGGFPLSYLAGANYSKHLIDEYVLGKNVSYYDDWEDNLLMLRYDDEVLVHDHEG